MKKIYYLLMFVFSFAICEAQYFSPGTQAQGHIDNKNYTVDYSTGTFYYSIPLFTVSSGSYNLPVTLSYIGKGKKTSDNPGIVGYNWSLLHGGVITRSIRSNPTYDEAQETDLYTLTLDGKSYNFVKRDDKYEFLEKTNLRLLHDVNDEWRLTEDNGVSYIFAAKEITHNAGFGEDFASSNVTVNEFVSAWYITEIQIPNSDNIYFEYSNSYHSNRTDQLDSVIFGDGHRAYYIYGNPMYYYSFDRYGALEEAKKFVQLALQEIYNASYAKMIDLRFRHIEMLSKGFFYCIDEESRKLDFEQYSELIENFYLNYSMSQERLLGFQATIMGVMIDISGAPWLCQSLVNEINKYMEIIEQIDRNSWALTCLRNAKGALSEALCKINEYKDKEQYVFSYYTIYTPHLKKIHCKNEEIYFDYTREGEFLFLQNIRFYDVKSAKTKEFHFELNNGYLKKMSWLGRNGDKVQDIAFDYYSLEREFNGDDEWGYPSNELPYLDSICLREFNRKYSRIPVDNIYCKQGSLKTIHLSNEEKIEIDYEANRCNASGVPKLFGGIRLKKIILKARNSNDDVIEYSYPNAGYLVFDDFYNWECIHQSYDYVFRNRMKYKGNVYVKAGNNGLYYDYVIENKLGKGYNTYLFCVPRPSSQRL